MADGEEGGSGREPDRFLPVANISRIMKKVLPANAKIAKDAKEAIQECTSEYISFITSEGVVKFRHLGIQGPLVAHLGPPCGCGGGDATEHACAVAGRSTLCRRLLPIGRQRTEQPASSLYASCMHQASLAPAAACHRRPPPPPLRRGHTGRVPSARPRSARPSTATTCCGPWRRCRWIVHTHPLCLCGARGGACRSLAAPFCACP